MDNNPVDSYNNTSNTVPPLIARAAGHIQEAALVPVALDNTDNMDNMEAPTTAPMVRSKRRP